VTTLALNVSVLLCLCLVAFVLCPMIFPVTMGGAFMLIMSPTLVGAWNLLSEEEENGPDR